MSVDLIKSVVIIALAIHDLQTYKPPPTIYIEPVDVFTCAPKPDVMYRICCLLPPFFTRDIAKECGGGVGAVFYNEKHNVSAFQRIAFDCTHWYCVLDKYSLLNANRGFEIDKYYAHLDLWVSLNPIFADVMLEAKVFCKDEFRPELPIQECPIYIPTPECDEKKEFLKECKQYFHKRK